MRKKRQPPVDVPRLLERLGIRATRAARTKLVARCPYPLHEDASPSWFIRDDPGGDYHATHCCKSCGFGGGAASLVEAVLGISDSEAREWLSDLRGPMPTPFRVEVEFEQRTRRHFRLPAACQTISPRALEYLSGRGVPLWQAVGFGLLEVPADARDESGERHRLRDRVVIPFRDRDGEVVSYTARAMFRTSKRYLEPSREECASEAAILGEHLWSDAQVACVVCEGSFDALSAHRALEGVSVAVAALRGSNPHVTQLIKLRRFSRVVAAVDNDPAGDRAWEVLREQLGGALELRRAVPPKGRDLGDMSEVECLALLEPQLRGMV